jgi:hypothetical protein
MGSCTKPTIEAHVPCPLATFDAFPALLSMCKRLSAVILFFCFTAVLGMFCG